MIDKPDSVSRVMAPITAMAKIIAQHTKSHMPTARGAVAVFRAVWRRAAIAMGPSTLIVAAPGI
jgi:hypothetical protein